MNNIKSLNKTIKEMNWWDVSLIKLSVLFATLFLLKLWPAFRDMVGKTNIWWFLILTIIFMARPLYSWFKK